MSEPRGLGQPAPFRSKLHSTLPLEETFPTLSLNLLMSLCIPIFPHIHHSLVKFSYIVLVEMLCEKSHVIGLVQKAARSSLTGILGCLSPSVCHFTHLSPPYALSTAALPTTSWNGTLLKTWHNGTNTNSTK
uniref:Uncharacterized protein n=1 Tax=Micrurus spixii TaxID=129469 RepID=A0A2D4LIJ6_9SAUR